MNWDAVGAVAEGLGALAVIISVLYLARQIRAQTQEAKLAATRGLASEFRSATDNMFKDKELSRLHRLGIHDYLSLDDDDRMRVSLMWFAILRTLEQQYLHNEQESMDSRYNHSNNLAVREFLAFPGVQTWWNTSRHNYIPEFVEEIDTLIKVANATDFGSTFRETGTSNQE